ncbi:MAG: hypothetical protein WBX22_16900 [Silvibacterium sp.]
MSPESCRRAVSAALVAVGPDILRFWVHRPIAPSFMLLLGLGVWSVMDAAGQSLAIFMNGTNTIVQQLIAATLFAAAYLPFKIFVIHRVGVAGVPWATFISYALLNALPCAFIIPRIVGSLAKRQAEHGGLLLPIPQSVPEEGNAIIL